MQKKSDRLRIAKKLESEVTVPVSKVSPNDIGSETPTETESIPFRSTKSELKKLVTKMIQVKQKEVSGKELQALLHLDSQDALPDSSTKSSLFCGIIGRCYIPDHDCHLLSQNFEIIGHYNPNQVLPHKALERARVFIHTLPLNIVALIVYEDRFEYVHSDGGSSPGVY